VWPIKIQMASAAASTAVQFQGCGTSMTEPCFSIPPHGAVLPVSSQPTGMFSLRLKKTTTATLTSLHVKLVAPLSASSIAANHFDSLRLYKRTSFGMGGYTFPANERIDDATKLNEGTGYAGALAPFVTVGSEKVSDNVITVATTGTHADSTDKNALGTDFWASGEYIVAIATSALWAGTDQVRYSMAADWITVSDGTLGSAYTYPSGLDDWYYATAPSGFMGETINVGSIDFISSTVVDVRFMADVALTSAETEANFELVKSPSNVIPSLAQRTDPRTVRLTFPGGTTITPNQSQIIVHGPGGVSNGVKGLNGNVLSSDLTLMVMGGGGGPGGTPLMISEVMIGQAGTGGGLKEFVEIHNGSGGILDLNAMGIKLWAIYNNGSTLTQTKITNVSSTIPANGYYLIASTQWGGTPTPDKTYSATGSFGLTAATEGALKPNSGVYISNSDTSGIGIIDKVGWGTATGEMSEGPAKCNAGDADACTVANDGKSLERKANQSATAVTMSVGGADVTNGNNYVTRNSQFDFIQRATADPQNTSSTPELPGGAGFGAGNMTPNIFHQPLFMGFSGSDLTIMADMGDDSGELSSANTKLYYRTHDDDGAGAGTTPGSWSDVTGIKTGPGNYKFIVPSVALNAAKNLDYYLRATDGTLYACMPGPCDAGTHLIGGAVTPNYVDITVSTGTGVISGFVKDATGAGINGVMVFLEGSPFVTTSNSSGDFTISGVDNGIYRLRAKGGAYASGGVTKNYTDGWIDGLVISAVYPTSSGNTITLMEGMGGQGGDQSSPMIMWSAPMDQMMGAPAMIDIKGLNQIEAPILLGFSKPMDTTTINSTNIAVKYSTGSGLVAASNICVIWEAAGAEAQLGSGGCARVGLTSVDFGPDQKAIIYSATPLLPNKQYLVELTGAVKDTAGNPLQGKRPGGGDVISFTTNAGDFGGSFGGGPQQTTFFKDGAQQTFNQTTSFASGGQFMPPYVKATIPSPGAKNVAKDTKIMITFSEPMDSNSINANTIKLYDLNYGGAGSGQYLTGLTISLDNSKTVVTVTPPANLSFTDLRYAIRVLGAAKSASGIFMAKPDTGYETRIMHQTDFEVGNSLDTTQPTVLGTNLSMYESSGVITGVPNSVGVIDLGFSEDMDSSTITGVSITLKSGSTTVATTVTYDTPSRSARIAPVSTLYTNTTYTITVLSGAAGVKAVNGAGSYNQIAADYTLNFTTSGTLDTGTPNVTFANADDYSLAVTFNESMKAVSAIDTNNWAYSVLNPANYVLYTDSGPPPAGSTVKYFSQDDLSGASTAALGGPVTIKYDVMSNTAVIEGLRLMDSQLTAKGGFRLWVRGVKDLSGNQITYDGTTAAGTTWVPSSVNTFGPNAAGGGVMNSQTTFGMIGPMGGGMMGPPPTATLNGGIGAGPAQDFGGKNVFNMGFSPIGVFPMNMQAGATSMYMVDIPITQALSSGDKIVLTFPTGFDVRGAKSGDPNNNWAHKDINGPGPGIVTLKTDATGDASGDTTSKGGLASDGAVVNEMSRTVTLFITVTGNSGQTSAKDFLHFEVDGIINSSTAKDFNTSGYTVDIKTQSSTRVLESQTSMPFFLKAKGSITLNVTVNFKNSSNAAASVTYSDLKLFLMSPMSGPIKQAKSFSNESTKTFTFSNLNAGMYQLMSDPVYTISSTDYYSDRGDPRPYDVAADNSNCTGSVCTATINIKAESTTDKPLVTVYLIGTFTGEDIDIFAGGPSGFRVKTINDLTAACTAANAHTLAGCSYTLSLPSTGKYMVGMGPAMQRGPEMMGPPPMPDWMPPRPVDLNVSGSAGSWTWADSIGGATADTTATDGKITISVTSANKNITGYVCKTMNDAGTACATDGQVANAEIMANSPMGGFSSNASSNSSDGSFTVKVKEGFYKVSAFLPGMPSAQEKSVEIRGSTMTVEGVVATSVILKVKVPDYTISGKVTDGSNVVKGAGVYAYRTDGPGHANAMTDSTGKYILYVDAGTWKVGAFIPGYGQLPTTSELSVTISTQSATNQNLNPAATSSSFSFVTIQDRVFKDVNADGDYDAGTDTPLSGVHVVAEGTNYTNDAMTDANGLYSIKVPTDPSGVNLANYEYDIKAWSPQVGKLPIVENVSSATDKAVGDAAAPIVVPDTKEVTINFVDADGDPVTVDTAFVQLDKIGVKGVRNDLSVTDKSSVTIQVPKDATCNTTTGANCYALDIDIPGISEQLLEESKIAAATSTTTLVGKDINGTTSTKEMYIVEVNGNESINVTLPNLYTVTGTVKDASNNVIPEAIVHIEKPGTEVEMDIKADSNGVYTATLPASSGTAYLIQADKVGYLDTASSFTVGGTTTANLTVDAATRTISGQVKVGSTGVAGATVIIEQQGGGFTTAETDGTGNYTAKVPAGDYKVSAVGEGYSEIAYQVGSKTAVVNTSSGNAGSIDVTLSTEQSGLSVPPTELVTPQNGGSVEHTSSTGVSLDLPPGALGSSSNDYRVTDKDSSNIPLNTPTNKIIGGEAKDIASSYQTSSGSQVPVQDLDDNMGIEMTYTVAQLDADGVDTFDEVEQMKAAYFDDTARNWASLPTNITYLGTGASADKVVIPTTDLSNVGKVIIAGKTDHMTVFGATNPTPDGLAPKTPSGVAAVAGSTSIAISWTAPTLNSDDSTLTDLLGYEIYRSTSSSGTYVQLNTSDILTTSYTDSTISGGTTYYYKVTAADTGGLESVMSSVVSAATNAGGGTVYSYPSSSSSSTPTTPTVQTPVTPPSEPVAGTETGTETSQPSKVSADAQITAITAEASVISQPDITQVLALVKAKRDLAREKANGDNLVAKVVGPLTPLSNVRYALINFVTYGTPQTLKLGDGERAGVVNSFKEAFGKLPSTSVDWSDVLKIAAGRWPSQTSAVKEADAEKTFKKIYHRASVRTNPNDDAAVVVMAYGLRPGQRNLQSEKAAIITFKKVFGKSPVTASDWDAVRATAYSGAKR